MTREAALAILRQSRPELIRRGVRRAALFGSTARDEARAASDVDVLVDMEPGSDLSLFEFVALAQFIESQFPVPVDVVDRATLKPRVRQSAERDAFYAF